MVNNHYSNTLRQLINTAYKRIAERGEVIAATDNLRSIFCIKEGFTKRFLIKNDGSISVQAIYGPGDCFGITTLTGLLLDSRLSPEQKRLAETVQAHAAAAAPSTPASCPCVKMLLARATSATRSVPDGWSREVISTGAPSARRGKGTWPPRTPRGRRMGRGRTGRRGRESRRPGARRPGRQQAAG